MAEAAARKRRRKDLGCQTLWYCKGIDACPSWWDYDWESDPAMIAWYYGDIDSLPTEGLVRECEHRDLESRRCVLEVEDAPTRDIDVAIECAYLHSGGLRFAVVLCYFA